MNGTGTVTLTGSNSYSGNTSVNSGRLVITDTSAFASNTATASGATFEVNVATGTQTVAHTISMTGTGTLIKSGTGTWVIGASGLKVAMNMTGGLIDIEGGTLQDNSSQAEWTNNKASLNIASGAILDMYTDPVNVDALTGSGTVQNSYVPLGTMLLTVGVNNGSGTFSGTIVGTGGNIAFTKAGTGTETLISNNTYTGTTTISGGVLQLGDGTLGDDGNIATSSAVVDNASLVFNRSTSQTMANTISGSGSVTKIGPGSQSLTGTNTYSGGTTLAAGTLGINFGGTSNAPIPAIGAACSPLPAALSTIPAAPLLPC